MHGSRRETRHQTIAMGDERGGPPRFAGIRVLSRSVLCALRFIAIPRSLSDSQPPGPVGLGRGNVAFLPRPSPGYLDLQREAQEGTDSDNRRQYRHARQSGRGGYGTDDVAGHEQLQAKQDGLAKALAETPVDVALAPGQPDGADDGRHYRAYHDDRNPGGIDGHPCLLYQVVV